MKNVIIFVLGGAAGSLITWKIVEKKYKKIADEEIKSVVETFKKKEEQNKEINEKNKVKTKKEEKVESNQSTKKVHSGKKPLEYDKKVKDLKYAAKEEEDDINYIITNDNVIEYIRPFVIAPEEFGETSYDTKSWTYYTDGLLADENDEIVTDPEDIIGDGLEHFGEYADFAVYVRNENTECDYEILKHNKTFDEANRVDR